MGYNLSFSVISVSSSFHAPRKRSSCTVVYRAGPFQVQSGVVRPFDVRTKRQVHTVLTVNKGSTILAFSRDLDCRGSLCTLE